MPWTRKLSKDKRYFLAQQVRGHRRQQFLHHMIDYSSARRLKHHNKQWFQLANFLQQQIERRKRPLRFLDSGAGLGGVGADLKKTFGAKINVTILSLAHPNVSSQTKRRAVKHVKENTREYFPFERSEAIAKGKEFAKNHRNTLNRARRDAAVVDKVRVGLVENLKRTEKYDIIFDYTGPLMYSGFKKRVAMQYYHMLPKGGIIITITKNAPDILRHGKGKFRQIQSDNGAAGVENYAIIERI